MREFIRKTLQNIVSMLLALFVATFALFLIGLILVVSLSHEKKTPVPERAVLVLDMGIEIPDAPLDKGTIGPLLRNSKLASRIPLVSVTDAIRTASTDRRIKGLLLVGRGPGLPETGLASVAEIRKAIKSFSESGKPVYAYVQDTSLKDYALACAADKVWMRPLCSVGLEGFSAERIYFGDAFRRYGIGVQTASAGAYKSAPDSYARDRMSPEDREQLGDFLSDAWADCKGMICQSRDIKPEELEALSQENGLLPAEKALEAHFVDRVAYSDEMDHTLVELAGPDASKETFSQISLSDYLTDMENSSRFIKDSSPAVVIEYVEGDIVDGQGSWNEAGADRIVQDLRSLRKSDDVKAVVLRVNSPGGDAIAADKIRREVALLTGKCPVVVSMGRMAASGGYWISAPANHIVAEPSTLTGSIGVFSLFMNIGKLADNWGVHSDSVSTSPFAGMYSAFRQKDERQMELARAMVDDIYNEFLSIVAEGRGIDPEKVATIAQGHIWSGTAAKSNGLVDEIGGLDEAIEAAAALAKLGDNYHVKDVPVSLDFRDQINSLISSHTKAAALLPQPVSGVAGELEQEADRMGRANLFARLPFFSLEAW